MHPLSRFLQARGLSQTQLAEMAGISRTVISRTLSGERPRFSVNAAIAIERATSGRVGLRELLGSPATGRKRRSEAKKTSAGGGAR